MRIIWKHKIKGADYVFDAPAGAEPKHTRIEQMSDGDQPVLYLLCDRLALPAKHQLKMFSTGAQIPDDAGNYAGTVVLKAPETGNLVVVHIFHKQLEIIKPS